MNTIFAMWQVNDEPLHHFTLSYPGDKEPFPSCFHDVLATGWSLHSSLNNEIKFHSFTVKITLSLHHSDIMEVQSIKQERKDTIWYNVATLLAHRIKQYPWGSVLHKISQSLCLRTYPFLLMKGDYCVSLLLYYSFIIIVSVYFM